LTGAKGRKMDKQEVEIKNVVELKQKSIDEYKNNTDDYANNLLFCIGYQLCNGFDVSDDDLSLVVEMLQNKKMLNALYNLNMLNMGDM
jgi:hypothetical protein